MHLLPKVSHVTTRMVTPEAYNKLIETPGSLKRILDDPSRGVFDYCCNSQLERGVRIEDIDPGLAYEETVAVKTRERPVPPEYVVVYVSGSTCEDVFVRQNSLWSTKQWAEFVRLFYRKYDISLPIVILGASYDQQAAREVLSALRSAGMIAEAVIDAPAAEVTYVIKKAKCFLGYQSGLGVLADNFDVPQVMMYFPYLSSMKYTWCKKSHIGKTFYADTFSRLPPDVVSDCTMVFQQ